jgi:hypothetical protein
MITLWRPSRRTAMSRKSTSARADQKWDEPRQIAGVTKVQLGPGNTAGAGWLTPVRNC